MDIENEYLDDDYRSKHYSNISDKQLQEIIDKAFPSKTLKQWRLDGATLYVTLEPCAMCAGAIVNSRLERLVFGAKDPKGGACGSLFNVPVDPRINHRVSVTSGILDNESIELLQYFFGEKRNHEYVFEPHNTIR